MEIKIMFANWYGKVLKELHYYPFGLTHQGYNEEKHEIKYNEQEDKIFTVQTVSEKYKYDFEKQERQTVLNLNWDSFKYRNYDYAIGRFMSVDPLADKYPYNATYAFSENRVINARELEGLEAFNSTTVLTLDVRATAGLAVGFNRGNAAGIAFDMVGITKFRAQTRISPSNQNLEDGSKNPRIISALEISGNLTGKFYFNKPLFSMTMNKFGFSMNKISLDVKVGVGGGIDVGDSHLGLHVGYGLGGSFFSSGNQDEITGSISLTYDEAKNIVLQGWMVVETEKTDEGIMGELYVIDPIKNACVSTGIKMMSDYQIDENGNRLPQSNNYWKSLNYIAQEKKYLED